jgi:hypothetical protein
MALVVAQFRLNLFQNWGWQDGWPSTKIVNAHVFSR